MILKIFSKYTLLLATILLALFSKGINAEEINLKLHHFLGTTSTTHAKFLMPWAKKIENESNNRIKITIYPSMQLGGKPPQLIDQVREGVADIVWTLPGYTPGRFPIVSVFELPFMISTAEGTSKALQAFSTKYLNNEFSQIHPLLFHVHSRGVFHTKKPINFLDDLKGITIRAPTRPIGNALKEMGATPIFMPVPQVPEALARGVVNGTMIPWEVALPLKVHELVGYHTEISGPRGLYTSVFLLAMHKPTYQALPQDLKTIIDDNSGLNIAGKIGEIWDKAESTGKEAAMKNNNEIILLTHEEVNKIRNVTLPAINIWLSEMKNNGIDGKKILDEAKELISTYTE